MVRIKTLEKQKNISGLNKMKPQEQLALLQSIFASSTEYSIAAVDLSGVIIAWNTGAERMYGYKPVEVIGKHANMLLHADEVAADIVPTIFEVVQKKGEWTGEAKRVRKDGTIFTTFTTVTMRKDIHGLPLGYTAISRDIKAFHDTLQLLSEAESAEKLLQINNKKLEENARMAQESNRLKSDFLANVSHELRTPLNGIIGFTEMLLDGLVDLSSQKYNECLKDILSSANQLLALINDVLDLSKIEAGKMDFHPVKVNLTSLFEETRDMFQPLILGKNINFIIEIDPQVNEVIIDPNRLKQVLYNFISNALKFTAARGKVIVRARSDKKMMFRIEIEDTGIGIRSEDLSKLFVKFVQLDSSSRKEYQGTGLGLALTKEIVEAQGGSVGVESIFGKGSIFYAILPCFPYHLSAVKEKVVVNEKARTILVIAKNSQDRALMIDALGDSGYVVVSAPSVKFAIEEFPDYQFDAIILDLFLPKTDNWELVHTLRSKKLANGISPFVVTATIEQPISIGFKIYDFLIKPVAPSLLLATLDGVVNAKNRTKSILIVDDDKKGLVEINQFLVDHGFRVIHKANKISALLALEQENPDVILLDPFMRGMDGFEFLRYYRQMEQGLRMPVILWTAGATDEKLAQLKNSLQCVVLREDEDLKRDFLNEIKSYLPSKG